MNQSASGECQGYPGGSRRSVVCAVPTIRMIHGMRCIQMYLGLMTDSRTTLPFSHYQCG